MASNALRFWSICVVAAIFCNDVTSANGDGQSGNSTHTGLFSNDNPLARVLKEVENITDIENKERTYIFDKHKGIIHEYVEDHRDLHQGRMEQVIEAWQARQKIIEEALKSHQGGDANPIDPHMEEEINYQNLKADVKNETGNHTFYDPDEANHNTDNVTSVVKRGKRTVEKSEWRRWPKGIIPYVIRPEVAGMTSEYKRAMNFYEEMTCIRFVEWVNESTNGDLELGHPGHVNYVSADGCWSYQGNMRWSGGQDISCCGGSACVHELGHALGVAHEHQSYLRDGWIRVNQDNIWPDSRVWYNRFWPGSYLTFGYDLSSTMHYQSWGFSSGGPTMTMLFPELYIGDSDYYMFMEIAMTHKCAETAPCANFDLTCENDGYKSIVRGKCACRCPSGLDPATGCTTTIKVPNDLKMPKGQYALPKPKTGCPDEPEFKDGVLTHYGEGKNYESYSFSLEGGFESEKATHHFCTRTADDFEEDPDFPGKSDWPSGSYCILKAGGECPNGFYSGFIQYDDKPGSEENTHSGDLPDGDFGSDSRLEFCCQHNAFERNAIMLPVDKPLVLFPISGTCQEVVGMHSRKEEYGFDSHNEGGKFEMQGMFKHYLNNDQKILYNNFCVYTPADMDCGGVITLDENNPTTFIEANNTGRSDMECTWIVRGPHENGTLILEFDVFDVMSENGRCKDSVEVRHARIGQKGLIYCGQEEYKSIRSITDKMMLKFTTIGSGSNSHFKAYFRWIPNSELCYDVGDRAVTYNGKMSHTRTLEPCIPWAEATECLHHPWQDGDELDNLDGNYCRNPDNSLRPWCYTAVEDCKRNYCDVCELEEAFDREEDCAQRREEGFCTDDVAKATQSCACTCNDVLPAPGPIERFSDITCAPPTAPVDGVPVDEPRSHYSLGDKVSYTCKNRASDVFTKTCMTNGGWSALGYVCVECPFGSVPVNDSCHLLINKQVTYRGAVAECEKVGGHMPTITSQEVLDAVKTAAKGVNVWLGVTDEETEGTFVWTDGSPVTFENWNDGEPNNWGGSEDCTQMQASGGWNDLYCDVSWATSAVLCTVPAIKEIPCEDFIQGQCAKLLDEKPTMCQDYAAFAEEFCARTCGICGAAGVTCPVGPMHSNVETSPNTTSPTINVGEYITYQCKENTYPDVGSHVRACKHDGTLTGDQYECTSPTDSTIKIGLPTLSKYEVAIPNPTVFTGENDLWTITHKGVILAWEYYSNSPMETAFMVWRVEEKEAKYKLIGKNVITTENDALGRYEVPVDDRIAVEKGDLIGIWNSGNGGVHFKACDSNEKPGWARVSWSRRESNIDNFVVGNTENFNADVGCCEFSFRAEVGLL